MKNGLKICQREIFNKNFPTNKHYVSRNKKRNRIFWILCGFSWFWKIKNAKMSKKKGMIVSGYFNPIHKWHIEYFNNAKALADELFVIVNSDYQRALKGLKEFQQEAKRVFIVSNIKSVILIIYNITK